jgi:hypothetical protein
MILGKRPAYEKDTFEYTVPAKTHKYTPDFKLKTGLYIESKGIWDQADRDKMLLMQNQHPEVIICMVFYNATYKIYPGSKTTYGDFCDKYFIPWCDIKEGIPKEWMNEGKDK